MGHFAEVGFQTDPLNPRCRAPPATRHASALSVNSPARVCWKHLPLEAHVVTHYSVIPTGLGDFSSGPRVPVFPRFPVMFRYKPVSLEGLKGLIALGSGHVARSLQ